MLKTSLKTKLDFISSFKEPKIDNNKKSSKIVIDLQLIRNFKTNYQSTFISASFFSLNQLPKQGFYNYISTIKNISTLDFLNLFAIDQIQSIVYFVTKMNKENQQKFKKFASITKLITNDELANIICKQTIICSTHAKALIFKVDKNHYTILGSGNPSKNSIQEQYIIFNDEFIYDHFQNLC